MKKDKKLLSLALAAMMFVSAFSSTAFASDMDDAYEVDRVDGKYAVVRVEDDGEYYDSKSSITIPSKINSRTITRIGDGDSSIFASGGSEKNIYLPNTVDIISDGAFEDSTVKRVSMEEGPVEIGERAFASCENLTSVTFADSITKMGIEAFSGCTSLRSAVLPASLTKIPDNAFQDCMDLRSVTIGSHVTSIGDSAFSGCDSLEEITIPPNVTRIGYDAFDDFILIKGYNGTAAQKYAEENDIDFENLGSSYSAAVRLSTSSLTVPVNGSNTFTVTNPTNGSFSVTSNSSAVSVTQSGSTVTVRGVSSGTATLTVSATGYASASLTVTVSTSAVVGSGSSLSLDTSSYSFNVGNVYYPLARTNSATAPTCTSSNPNVVTVKYQADRSNRADLRGSYTHAYLYQIQGKSAGTATITITSGSYSASFPVTVGTSPNGSAFCNPSVNFGIYKGRSYDVQMTVTGSNNMPSFTVGNGNVFKTQYVGKSGNVYTFRVWAIGNPGEKTGLYTQMPGDSKVVLHCEGQIAYG